MNLLAIVGSPRKGKATDILVDKAIAGVKSRAGDCEVRKINLIDHDIRHCRNCLTCRDSKTEDPVARCTIRDDMDTISTDLVRSDILIFGTPVHMGYATALITIFLERLAWTFAKPARTILTVSGIPLPRSDKRRKAVIIVTSSIVPPLLRMFCDQATPYIKSCIRDSLNARTIGDMYAGDLEHRGVEYYFDKAFNLGKRLV